MLQHYYGTDDEKSAQALRDIAGNYVERHEQYCIIIGAICNEFVRTGLHEKLGYSNIDDFFSGERIGGLGRTQLWIYMGVARATPPPGLDAPTLKAVTLNTASPRPLLHPDFVTQVGITRANAVVRKWPKSTPKQRQELLDAALTLNNQDFFDQAYGSSNKVSFSVQGDTILLWEDSIGTEVAVLKTTDSRLRGIIIEKLTTGSTKVKK